MPFDILAAAIPSVVGLASGAGQSGAVNAGSSAALAAAQQAISTGTTNRTADRANFAPYVKTGQNALTQYADLTGINGQPAADAAMSTFQASPGYQYQVSEGERALDQSAASQGILNSGATLKAEQTLGANLANQDFSAYTTRLNTLASGGLTGAQGDNTATASYNTLLNGQTNSLAGTNLAAAGANASIFGNTGNQLQNALYTNSGTVGSGLNSLFGASTGGTFADGTYGASSLGPVWN